MSTETDQSVASFGWYPDPHGMPILRWWDGSAWTDRTEKPRVEIHRAGVSHLYRDLVAAD
jgi:hypothetical protein